MFFGDFSGFSLFLVLSLVLLLPVLFWKSVLVLLNSVLRSCVSSSWSCTCVSFTLGLFKSCLCSSSLVVRLFSSCSPWLLFCFVSSHTVLWCCRFHFSYFIWQFCFGLYFWDIPAVAVFFFFFSAHNKGLLVGLSYLLDHLHLSAPLQIIKQWRWETGWKDGFCFYWHS